MGFLLVPLVLETGSEWRSRAMRLTCTVIADTSYVQRFLLARLAIDAAQRARSEVKNQLLPHVLCVQFRRFGLICLSSSGRRSQH
jgi:hypothetical protein